MADPVTFLHLTDLHLMPPEAEAAKGPDAPSARLRAVWAAARALSPAFVAITGDLTDCGDAESYAVLAAALAEIDVPVLLTLGNHDARGPFRDRFAPGSGAGPWLWDRTIAGLHLIGLDTLVPGQTAGGLAPETLGFAQAALAREPGLPKLIFLHHPPATPLSQGWDSLDPGASAALAALVRDQAAALFCGHIHQDRTTIWHGLPVFAHAGLANGIDPARRDALRLIAGANWGLGTWDGAGPGLSVVPLAPARATLRTVPLPA